MAFYIKQNDTSPSLQATLTDASGTAINLTGASVRLHMKAVGAFTLKVDEAMTISDATGGVVVYDWQGGDTDTFGTYNIEFEVTYSDSSVETFPNSGSETVIISKELG